MARDEEVKDVPSPIRWGRLRACLDEQIVNGSGRPSCEGVFYSQRPVSTPCEVRQRQRQAEQEPELDEHRPFPNPRARVTLHVSCSDTPRTCSRLNTRPPRSSREVGGGSARLRRGKWSFCGLPFTSWLPVSRPCVPGALSESSR